MKHITFMDNNGTFRLEKAQEYSYLYFPVASGTGLKSAVTPELGGDAKMDQNHFLLQPVSAEEPHNNKSSRNFWCRMEDGGYFSATGVSAMQQAAKFSDHAEDITVEAGLMWHKVSRKIEKYGIKAEVLSFVPEGVETEVMQVTLTNEGTEPVVFTPVGAIPVYGRSADNLRDHRHVTSLLHRAYVTEDGICVQPVLSFDEREVILETEQGMLMMKGSGLHVNRLTLDKGEVDVEGKIDSFTYSEQASMTAKSESLLTRLFK